MNVCKKQIVSLGVVTSPWVTVVVGGGACSTSSSCIPFAGRDVSASESIMQLNVLFVRSTVGDSFDSVSLVFEEMCVCFCFFLMCL